MRFVLVCLGGGIGTGARYLLTIWLSRAATGPFPAGTFVVNVLGSFLLALIVYGMPHTSSSETTRVALATGVMGGFTTYSAFNQQVLDMLRGGLWSSGLVYLTATIVGCLAAAAAGIAVGRMIMAS